MAMHPVVSALMALFSVLMPSKLWYAPGQPLNVTIQSDKPLTLVMTDFTGKSVEAKGSADVTPGQTVDVAQLFPPSTSPGTYVLYAVPKGGTPNDFVGTPVVIEVRVDRRPGAPTSAMVTRVEPLRYAVMQTEHGPVTMVFYFDAAPNTVDSFLRLAEGGYFDGLTFHRIVPDFVIQGGDPLSANPNPDPSAPQPGTGGPGYHLDAEFNDKKHEPGVLSMARNGDPAEGEGMPPRPQFANSAGSQFFICLNYASTQQLDGKYTAFGKVVDGMDAVKQIAATKIADPATGRPEKPQVIQKIEIFPVTPGKNPYKDLLNLTGATTQP